MIRCLQDIGKNSDHVIYVLLKDDSGYRMDPWNLLIES